MKLKDYIIIGLIAFLLFSGVLNWFQDKWNKEIKSDRDRVALLNDQLLESRENLNTMYEAASDSIKVLERIVDSLENSYALKTAEMVLLKEKHLKEIEDLKYVPPDTIYRQLLDYYYLDNGPKKYPFTGGQVRGIYSDKLKLNYNLTLNKYLQGQITDLSFTVKTKDNIIKYKDVQIGALQTDLTLTSNYTDELEGLNKDLNRAYKSERTTRYIWQSATGAALIFIILSSLR